MAGVDRGGRPRDPRNDSSILEAALDLLIERGAGGASVEAIAQRAGVAKMTVYRRWRSKEDLLMAALEYARTSDMDTGGAARSIAEVVAVIADQLCQPRFRSLMARVIGASVDYPLLIDAYVQRYLKPRLTALADTTRRAIDEGRFPSGTDPIVIQDVLANSVGFALLNDENLTAEQIADRLWAVLRQLGYRDPTG